MRLMSLASRRAWRKRWRKSSMAGARSSAGMQWKQPWGVEKAVGGEDVEVGMEDEVIAEGVDSGDGGEFPIGEVEADAEGIAQGFSGGVEEVGEEMAAFAEDTA